MNYANDACARWIAQNTEMSWDGTYNGAPCQIGVYALIIEYNTTDDSHASNLKYTGTLNLIR